MLRIVRAQVSGMEKNNDMLLIESSRLQGSSVFLLLVHRICLIWLLVYYCPVQITRNLEWSVLPNDEIGFFL